MADQFVHESKIVATILGAENTKHDVKISRDMLQKSIKFPIEENLNFVKKVKITFLIKSDTRDNDVISISQEEEQFQRFPLSYPLR